jgi:hypothetical protein
MRWAALLRNQDNTPERGATRKRFTADPRCSWDTPAHKPA